ncbi:MAG TPA: LPS export ABC transporter permease LptF [Gammaproteobacteria bacterium]|nr:LPS export ABC transporter permease LptF [Gammaproteobacteria bacterium]
MSLISRYILRETFAAWLIVVAVLLTILMTKQFADILGEAAAERLPRDAIWSIFGLTTMRYVTLLTPIALFLGVMLALARLNRDCEAAALAACGVGPGRLLVPILTLTVVLAAVLAWFSLFLNPAASARIDAIKLKAQQEMHIGALEPGKFMSPDNGKTVLYAREVVDNRLIDTFLEQQQGDRVVVTLADRGERIVDPATGDVSFVLRDGRRYEGVPGGNEFLVVEFDEHGIPIRRPDDAEVVETAFSRPTSVLFASSLPADRAELQWRLSVPISVLVLALLAVPLSRSAPREGRYAKLGIGLLVYIVYVNMLSTARIWVERGLVPDWLGLWWVHVAAAAVAGLLLVRHSGVFARARLVPVEALP